MGVAAAFHCLVGSGAGGGGRGPRNASYVSAESLTLLSLSLLVNPFSLGSAQLHLALVVATLVLVYSRQRSILYPLSLSSKGATDEDEVEKELAETPLRQFPYDKKLVATNFTVATVLSFFSSNEALAQRGLYLLAGEPVHTTVAESIEFQLAWMSTMLALHATVTQALPVLVLYESNPHKTPHKDPLHLTLTQNEKQGKPKLPVFVTAWIAMSVAAAAVKCIVLVKESIEDQQHLSSHVAVVALTVMQPIFWAGVIVVIKIRNRTRRHITPQ